MTQKSMFWDGVALGDAAYAPYDAATEFAKVLISLCAAGAIATHLSGVCRDELSELAVTGAASPISVAAGRALCYGSWFESDAAVAFTISTPGGSTRIDRVVVAKDWAAQTTRLAIHAGTPGAGIPALTQVLGTLWEEPLYRVSITTGGVITLTDERDYVPRYAHQHLGTRDDSAQLVLGSIPDGMFTADAAGRAKFENGFVTPALMGGSWPTNFGSATVSLSAPDDTWVDIGTITVTLPANGFVSAYGFVAAGDVEYLDMLGVRIVIDASNGDEQVHNNNARSFHAMHRVAAVAGVSTIKIQGRRQAGTGSWSFYGYQLLAMSSAA